MYQDGATAVSHALDTLASTEILLKQHCTNRLFNVWFQIEKKKKTLSVIKKKKWTEKNAGQFIFAAFICSNLYLKLDATPKLGPGHFWLASAWGHATVASHTKVPTFSNLPQTTISHTAVVRHCFTWQECSWPMLQIQVLFLLTSILPMSELNDIHKIVETADKLRGLKTTMAYSRCSEYKIGTSENSPCSIYPFGWRNQPKTERLTKNRGLPWNASQDKCCWVFLCAYNKCFYAQEAITLFPILQTERPSRVAAHLQGIPGSWFNRFGRNKTSFTKKVEFFIYIIITKSERK